FNELISFSEFSINQASVNLYEENLSTFDSFVTGSDQVWNPNFRKGSPIDFLQFAPKNKRNAFAASFVVASIPEKYIEQYTNYLNDMNSISVREKEGQKIVHDLTGSSPALIVDPTLLISQEHWQELSLNKANKPKNKFI